VVGRSNAGDVDSSEEHERAVRVDVQLVGVLQHDAQAPVQHVVSDRRRPNHQHAVRRRTVHQPSEDVSLHVVNRQLRRSTGASCHVTRAVLTIADRH